MPELLADSNIVKDVVTISRAVVWFKNVDGRNDRVVGKRKFCSLASGAAVEC